jgi:hypothetical protein
LSSDSIVVADDTYKLHETSSKDNSYRNNDYSICNKNAKRVECYAMFTLARGCVGKETEVGGVAMSLYTSSVTDDKKENSDRGVITGKPLAITCPGNKGTQSVHIQPILGNYDVTFTCSKLATARSRSQPLPSRHCIEKVTLRPVR